MENDFNVEGALSTKTLGPRTFLFLQRDKHRDIIHTALRKELKNTGEKKTILG